MTVLRYLTALLALCVALGYLDAVTTFALRGTLEVGPEGVDLPRGDLARAAVEAMPARLIALEQTRQAATVLLLITVAFVAGRNALQQWGTFFFALGGWTVFRYVAIRTITDWPASLTSADAIVVLPRPVYAPVWLPVVVALGLMALGVALIRAGALALRRRSSG